MNEQVRHFRAAVATLRAETWSAWRLGERESYPLVLGDPETLDEALMAATAQATDSGQIIAIQHSHAGRRQHTLWQFRVTRSKHKGTWRDSTNGGRKVFVGKLEAKLIAQIALAEPFAPALPFDAFRDCPVGRDSGLVEINHG